ncbi:putative ferric-chelate reductase 1 homolog isoform X4 [Eurosta solidaginis]|uniref:putative ferric-chelate reductase 1 homolog isoform X4 n=1 Tax=Eurosta solidaginis TaxID=178769 RepID=UPI003530D5D2
MLSKRRRTLPLIILLIALQMISWTSIMSLPQGAPESVCDTMLPFHGGGIPPASSLPPYRIETSSLVIRQGQAMRVDIIGVPPGLSFGGFMVQARNRNSPHQIIGQFNSSLDGRVKLMNCENSVGNSATHANPTPKQSASLEWQSPLDFLGEVVFNATVAQAYDSFWVGIPSSPVQVVRRDTNSNYPQTTRLPYVPPPPRGSYAPKTETPSMVEISDDPFYFECGRSKTCFGWPDGCIGDKSCKLLSAIIVRGDVYEFEMKSGSIGAAYIALGLSNDNKMGDDLVTECIPQNGKVNLYTSYTSGGPNYAAKRTNVWHRVCMVVTWSLTMTAFIIIFVEIGGWSTERNPHAILGTITTAICFIQPIGALFRPAPTSKSRPIFNWTHWLGGNLAHILSIVTIFFAVQLTKAELPEWMDWILVGFVVVHVIVHLIYSIFGFSSDRQYSQQLNVFQMSDLGHHNMSNGHRMDSKTDAPYASFRKGLLAVYTVVLTLFVVVLVLIVVLAPIEETINTLKSN